MNIGLVAHDAKKNEATLFHETPRFLTQDNTLHRTLGNTLSVSYESHGGIGLDSSFVNLPETVRFR